MPLRVHTGTQRVRSKLTKARGGGKARYRTYRMLVSFHQELLCRAATPYQLQSSKQMRLHRFVLSKSITAC